jgi:hypothetical protein
MIANFRMKLIPVGLVPLRRLVIGVRIDRLWQLVPSHCLSVLALVMRMIARASAHRSFDGPLFRHRGSFAD